MRRGIEGGTRSRQATSNGAASYIMRYGVTSDGRSNMRPSNSGVATSDERHLQASARNHNTAPAARAFEKNRIALWCSNPASPLRSPYGVRRRYPGKPSLNGSVSKARVVLM